MNSHFLTLRKSSSWWWVWTGLALPQKNQSRSYSLFLFLFLSETLSNVFFCNLFLIVVCYGRGQNPKLVWDLAGGLSSSTAAALLPCHILSQCQSHPRLAHIHSLLVSFFFFDSVLVLVPQPSQTADFQFLLRSQCPQWGLRSPQRDCSRQPVKEGKSEIKKSWQIAQRNIAAKKRREESARVSNCGIYAIA